MAESRDFGRKAGLGSGDRRSGCRAADGESPAEPRLRQRNRRKRQQSRRRPERQAEAVPVEDQESTVSHRQLRRQSGGKKRGDPDEKQKVFQKDFDPRFGSILPALPAVERLFRP